MIRSLLLRLGWFAALLAVASFFLPWIVFRHPLAAARHAALSLSSAIAADAEKPWWQDYVLPEQPDFKMALERPLEGESAFVVAKEAQGAAPAERHRTVALAKIFNLPDPRMAGVIVYAVPALAVLGAALVSLGVGRIWLLLLGILSAGGYVLVRGRFNETFLDRATSGVGTGLGLWLALWALALGAVVVLLSAFATGKK